MGKPLKISSYLLISLNILFLTSAIALIALVTVDVREQALVDAQAKAQLIMDRNLATHLYFTHHLRPKVFEITRDFLSPGFFEPVWMSSTYALRQIQHYFLELNPEGYYYREAAIDARSPSNEADEQEKSFLKDLAANPNLPARSAFMSVDGKPSFTVMQKSQVFIPACLQCHSSPQEAPLGLIQIYGRERGFGREVGQVPSVSSIQIPLSQAYSHANSLIWRMSLGTVVVLMILFILIMFINKRYLLSPLAAIREKASLIVSNPEHLGEQIDKPKGRELMELVDTFNTMSKQLRQGRDDLEQRVIERTQYLEQALEELKNEIDRRKQVENSLQIEKDKIRDILENMNDGVYIVSPEYDFEYVNPVLKAGFGEVKGRKCYEYFHNHSEPCPWCYNQRVFAGESVQREWYSDKTGRTYELFDTPIRHSDGTLSKLEIFHDITDRKQAEDGLRKSEERFRQVAQSTGDWIWEVDKDGMFTYCTSVSERILGYSADELVGQKFFYDMFLPEVKEELKQQALAAFESKELFRSFTNPNVRKDGQIVILETSGSPITDEDGNLIGYRGVDADVTERVKAEEAAKRLTTAIEQATEGIVILDSQGTIEYVNSGYEQITGYHREEVLGTRHHLFEREGSDELLYASVQEVVLKGLSWSGRIRRIHKNGEKYPAELRLSPVRNTAGKIVNYVAIKRDVSHELSMQQQLLQAQKMQAVGNLAGGIAHDFNNILQVVLGYSELLLTGKENTDKEFTELDKINSASRRGADLVQNLMMFSRKVEPNLKPLNLNDEVNQIQKLLSRTIPKNIKLTALLSGDLKLVEADVSQMGQILMNLAVNARDAMPDGGKLNFETSNVDLDEEFCFSHPGSQPGTFVLLTVSDAGTGMTEETLSHIFEPFFTTKGVGHGTGLGLATVYGIVKQHRGYITCESEIGTGTTFKVYLPAIDKECENDSQECKAPLVGGTETILLVDDEEHLRDLGATILQRYGYEVITAENGTEALGTYLREQERISLVILDIIMPEMDGKRCLVEILKINPNAKVLIASGYSETSSSMPRLIPGAKGLVTKPYDMRKLLQTVREVLDSEG